MQKLVKKTRHYQTLVPVEAYEGEEGYLWQDEIDAVIWGIGVASLRAPAPFNTIGGVICAVGTAANTDTGREFIAETIEAIGEYRQREFEAYQMAGEASLETARNINDAFGDAVIDWVSGLDTGVEDPYGEHGTYYANE